MPAMVRVRERTVPQEPIDRAQLAPSDLMYDRGSNFSARGCFLQEQTDLIPYATPLPIGSRGGRLIGMALAAALAANGVAVVAAASLWSVPRGTPVRPMFEAAVIFLAALVAFVVGVPLSVIGLTKARRSPRLLLLGVLAMTLSATPMFAGAWVWSYIERVHGLVMEP